MANETKNSMQGPDLVKTWKLTIIDNSMVKFARKNLASIKVITERKTLVAA